jgi:hypothetical protein
MFTEISEVLAAFIIGVMNEALTMEAVQTSEALVNFYQTTWRYNLEDIRRRQNLKSSLTKRTAQA